MSFEYQRVIPRDFFNEAKLLKCLGQLALKVLDGHAPDGLEVKLHDDMQPFGVTLDGETGNLYAANVSVTYKGVEVEVATSYNSRAVYPLSFVLGDSEGSVFDDNGNFDSEFLDALKVEGE